MNTLENNAFFWQKLDTLYLSSKLIVDRPKGTCHYKYSNLEMCIRDRLWTGQRSVFT